MELSARELEYINVTWMTPKATLFADAKLRKDQPLTLKEAREASLRTAAFMATKLSITKASYQSIENNEMKGAATVASLRRAAEALDCEFVYSIKPRNKARFRDSIFSACMEYALKYPQVQRATDPNLRMRFIAARMNEALYNPKFKRMKQWVRDYIPFGRVEDRVHEHVSQRQD